MLRDLRLALRMLAKAPAFTAIALLTLALGIGANTAIFSLVDAVLLRPLPVSQPEQLLLLSNPAAAGGMSMGTSDGRRDLLAYSEYTRLRQQTQVFTGLAAAENDYPEGLVSWPQPGQAAVPETVHFRMVSDNFFRVLGVPAYRGRMLSGGAAPAPNADPVAVLRYGYWKQRFHSDPAALGRSFLLHGHAFTVIGIAPPGFSGLQVGTQPDFWVPASMQAQARPGRDLLHDPPGTTRIMWLQVIGRLKPGVTMAAAQAAANAIFKQSVEQQAAAAPSPAAHRALLSQHLELSTGAQGASAARSQFATALWAMFALVGLVLLLAVVNLASLLLARAASRRKEMTVRLAMGASRSRILRQLLTESVLLSLAGGALGVLLALWGVRLLLGMLGTQQAVTLSLAPDWRVFGFVLGISVLAGLLFGLAPAWRMARLNLNATLQSEGRAVHQRMPLGKALVTGQVALSVILLVGAGLFLHSLRKLQNQPLGFNPDHLVASAINLGPAGYKDAAAASFFHQFLGRAAALPGVQHIALSMVGLFSGSNAGIPVGVNGYVPQNAEGAGAGLDQVSADYFATVGIPIVAGRGLTLADDTSAVRHVVINQEMAKVFFAGKNPIGQQIHDLYPDDHGMAYTVVGVCADSKHNSPGEKPMPMMYFSFFNGLPVAGVLTQAGLLVREAGSAAAVNTSLRHLLSSMGPSLRVQPFVPLSKEINGTLATQMLLAKLSAFFGFLALLLAAIGLYGVMAYSVARRTAEIGVRMALGASGGAILGLVMRELALLLAAGLAIGIPLSLIAAKMAAHQMALFDLSYNDPAALAGAVVVLAAVAALAGWLPARRASRIDPLLALRQE